MITNLATPGVYIDEVNAFPNSAVEVDTAIPAFIGYTPQASFQGQNYLMKPVMVTSWMEFQSIFALPADPTGKTQVRQYNPNFTVAPGNFNPQLGTFYNFDGTYYTVQPDQSTLYYMYNMVQMYYQNGGTKAYIVSVGTYGEMTNDILQVGGAAPLNSNVKLTDLQAGLDAMAKNTTATMYVVPEATLLSPEENSTLMQAQLQQAGDLMTCMPILDVIGGWQPDIRSGRDSIDAFRNAVGNNALRWGASYWPYLHTTLMGLDQFDYTNLNGGDTSTLDTILNPPGNPNEPAANILQGIQNGNGMTAQQNNAALLQASPTYRQLMGIVQDLANIIPPSGCMAGVWALTDATKGVFYAPANTTPLGVVGLTLDIDDQEQEGLNVDAASGKSIAAIRSFPGNGILVWGARTLDGNSQDWRYINVRRTVTMIQQSLKLALRAFVFEPNDSNTWQSVIAMTTNFLTNQWKSGALQGASAADAFSVACGLGTTMTPQDILDGYLRLNIKIAVVRPAEFIVLQVMQQMPTS